MPSVVFELYYSEHTCWKETCIVEPRWSFRKDLSKAGAFYPKDVAWHYSCAAHFVEGISHFETVIVRTLGVQ